ncbi:hypothetical protein M3Y98_00685500 [Aphelenchoides besseyi]|nr:hypothetical protein M3Y98_00685500 [Aphelenchoides besseyi]
MATFNFKFRDSRRVDTIVVFGRMSYAQPRPCSPTLADFKDSDIINETKKLINDHFSGKMDGSRHSVLRPWSLSEVIQKARRRPNLVEWCAAEKKVSTRS